jgi:hypothetical protein
MQYPLITKNKMSPQWPIERKPQWKHTTINAAIPRQPSIKS